MKTFLLISLCFLQYFAFGQNRSFLLNSALPMYANPAFTGSAANPRLNYGFSGQNFSQSTTSSIEHYLSYDRHIKDINSGFGIEIYNRNFGKGAIITSSVALNYAYQHTFLDNVSLSVGGGLYYKNQFNDLEKIPAFAEVNNVTTYSGDYVDYKLGAVLYTNAYFLSLDFGRFQYGGAFGGDKIRQNTLGFEVGQILRLRNSQEFSIMPTLSYFITKSDQLLSLQVVAQLKDFYIGGKATVGQNVSLLTGYNLGPLRIKFAAALNTNKLINGSHQQFDLTLQFDLPNGQIKSRRGFVLISNETDKISRKTNAFKFNLF